MHLCLKSFLSIKKKCGKKYKFFFIFRVFEFPPEIRNFLILELESSISRNIRNYFRAIFFFFFYYFFSSGVNDDLTNWWLIFVVWLTEERRLALFAAVIIDPDPHHHKFLPANQIWNCAKSDLRLWWMKLHSSDNYYATAPKAFPLETFYS